MSQLQQLVQLQRWVIQISKFSSAISGEAGPIPWDHKGDQDGLAVIFEAVNEPPSQTTTSQQQSESISYRMKIVQEQGETRVLEELDLNDLGIGVQQAALKMQKSGNQIRNPEIAVVVRCPCIAVRYPVQHSQVRRFQIKMSSNNDFHQVMQILSWADVRTMAAESRSTETACMARTSRHDLPVADIKQEADCDTMRAQQPVNNRVTEKNRYSESSGEQIMQRQDVDVPRPPQLTNDPHSQIETQALILQAQQRLASMKNVNAALKAPASTAPGRVESTYVLRSSQASLSKRTPPKCSECKKKRRKCERFELEPEGACKPCVQNEVNCTNVTQNVKLSSEDMKLLSQVQEKTAKLHQGSPIRMLTRKRSAASMSSLPSLDLRSTPRRELEQRGDFKRYADDVLTTKPRIELSGKLVNASISGSSRSENIVPTATSARQLIRASSGNSVSAHMYGRRLSRAGTPLKQIQNKDVILPTDTVAGSGLRDDLDSPSKGIQDASQGIAQEIEHPLPLAVPCHNRQRTDINSTMLEDSITQPIVHEQHPDKVRGTKNVLDKSLVEKSSLENEAVSLSSLMSGTDSERSSNLDTFFAQALFDPQFLDFLKLVDSKWQKTLFDSRLDD